MGLNVGSTPLTAVYVGSTPVTAVYVGAEKIWPTTRETVQITLGTGLEARDQFRAALTGGGLDYATITEVPFGIELVGTGSAQYMFYGCLALTSVPDMDTSQVTNTSFMFYNCAALTDGNVRLIGRHPQVDTTSMITGSGLTREPFYDVVQITLGTGLEARDQLRAALSARGLNYQTVEVLPLVIELVGTGSTERMFSGCSSLTHVPDMDTSLVTKANYMFEDCAALTDGNVRLIGRHPQVTTAGIIRGSGLTRGPFYDANGNPI